MNELEFWSIVQEAHDQSEGDMDKKCELIADLLGKLPGEEAIAFSQFFDAMMDRAYAWPLWGAAYVINGGCGDDSFTDFRASLISRGQQAFESALADPDAMPANEYDEDSWFYEGYQYAIDDGVETAAGRIVDRIVPHPDTPSGEAWNEEDVYELYPRLSAAFA
jgi:hypothetical protein